MVVKAKSAKKKEEVADSLRNDDETGSDMDDGCLFSDAETLMSGGNPDEMVMVLFPRITFDSANELAVKYGRSFGELMSFALKRLADEVGRGEE